MKDDKAELSVYVELLSSENSGDEIKNEIADLYKFLNFHAPGNVSFNEKKIPNVLSMHRDSAISEIVVALGSVGFFSGLYSVLKTWLKARSDRKVLLRTKKGNIQLTGYDAHEVADLSKILFPDQSSQLFDKSNREKKK